MKIQQMQKRVYIVEIVHHYTFELYLLRLSTNVWEMFLYYHINLSVTMKDQMYSFSSIFHFLILTSHYDTIVIGKILTLKYKYSINLTIINLRNPWNKWVLELSNQTKPKLSLNWQKNFSQKFSRRLLAYKLKKTATVLG